jgi:osmotically-inducible protein OsmY
MRFFVLGLALVAIAAAPPHGARGDDQRIAEQIVSKLQAEKDKGTLRGFNIDLEVEEGAVYLKGHVSESQQEAIAIDIARRAPGVKKVYNGLVIKSSRKATEPQLVPSPAPARSLALTPSATPENQLRLEKEESQPKDGSSSPALATETKKDTSPAPASEAAEPRPVAKLATEEPSKLLTGESEPLKTDGAADKTNGVTPAAKPKAETLASPPIAPTPKIISSREIAESIVSRLQEAKSKGNLVGFAIDVEVCRGEVTLKGQVTDPDHAKLARSIASETAGVGQVIDRLTIQKSEELADSTTFVASTVPLAAELADAADSQSTSTDSETIAQRVLARLQEQKRQEKLRNFGIDVQVNGTTVWVTGYVSSREQETLVLDVTRTTPGVGMVVNNLRVAGLAQAFHALPTASGTIQPVGQLASHESPIAASPAPGTTAVAPATIPAQPVAAYGPYGYGAVPGMQLAQAQTPLAFAPAQPVNHMQPTPGYGGTPMPMGAGSGVGIAPARFDHPQMPGYAWPSYAAYPNYAGVTYPQQYSASAWPYIGPFYPYPQVPLGWRRVTLEWDDGWWFLKFKNKKLH